jgi:hypothetical protein
MMAGGVMAIITRFQGDGPDRMDRVDFRFLKKTIGLSRGYLPSHIRRRERAFVKRYPWMRYGLQGGDRHMRSYKTDLKYFLKKVQL